MATSTERIERICASGLGDRALRLQVLDAIRPVVGFDAYAWLLTDPQTSVGAAPLADVPCLPELPRLIRLKYLTDVNRWTRLDGAALLHEVTGGELSRSLVWREMLHAYGVRDVASVAFRDRFGCWGFLDLWRCDATFGAKDAAFLSAVAAPVTAALRRSQAAAFTGPAASQARGPVVLLLSAGLDVLAQTDETERYLRELVPPAEGHAPVPASAYNVAAQLLAVEADVDDNPPTARVHLTGGRWLTLRAARIGADIAVTIEESSPPERIALFGRAFGLSARECELLDQLATGAATRELARRMFLSEHTVHDHLKSIFAKTATRTRPALLSLALGASRASC